MNSTKQTLLYWRGDLSRYPLRYAVLLLVMLCGFFFGLTSPGQMEAEAAEQCRAYIGDYLELLPAVDASGKGEFLRALAMNGGLLLILMAAGLHLCGAPLIVAVLFYKCFTLGFATCFLLAHQGWPGVALILFALLPQNIVLLPLLLRCGSEAMSMSSLLWRDHGAFVRDKAGVLGAYAGFCATALLLTALAAVLQGYFSPLLLQLLFAVT